MKKIDVASWDRKTTYEWFNSFANPCYGFDCEMDITKLVRITKEKKQSFFINFLYIITLGMNKIEEMRTRIVNDEVVVYDIINPTYTIMTDASYFVNGGHQMTNDYKTFYCRCQTELETKKKSVNTRNQEYNDSKLFDDFYITCVPWITYKSMTHPIPDYNKSSQSVPRVCWGKYYQDGEKTKVLLNITVSHAVCDGYPLSKTFNTIQAMLDEVEEYLK